MTLTSAPASAIAQIAADSKYWLWINGKLAVFEGGLKRGPNRTDTYYDEIDLKPPERPRARDRIGSLHGKIRPRIVLPHERRGGRPCAHAPALQLDD